MELLQLPSGAGTAARWTSDLEYPSVDAKSLANCPRRIGLVSQGLLVVRLERAEAVGALWALPASSSTRRAPAQQLFIAKGQADRIRSISVPRPTS